MPLDTFQERLQLCSAINNPTVLATTLSTHLHHILLYNSKQALKTIYQGNEQFEIITVILLPSLH